MELKLAAAASDLPKLQRALLDLAPGSAASCLSLTTTYYDTADRALLRHGLSLRVREAAGRFVQTVKADGTDMLTRGEWEDEIATPSPIFRRRTAAAGYPERSPAACSRCSRPR